MKPAALASWMRFLVRNISLHMSVSTYVHVSDTLNSPSYECMASASELANTSCLQHHKSRKTVCTHIKIGSEVFKTDMVVRIVKYRVRGYGSRPAGGVFALGKRKRRWGWVEMKTEKSKATRLLYNWRKSQTEVSTMITQVSDCSCRSFYRREGNWLHADTHWARTKDLWENSYSI